MPYKAIQPNSTISLQLLKSIFGIYCIISISVTLLQMVAEFHHQKDQLNEELLQINKIFGNAIATAVWTLDDSQLLSVMKGILELNSVLGVQVIGTVEKAPQLGFVMDETNQVLRFDRDGNRQAVETSPLGLFSQDFPIYAINIAEQEIGTLRVYSSSELVFEKVKYGFIVLTVNAIIKTAALWIIFLIFVNKIVAKPLTILTEALRKIDPDNPKPKDQSELDLLSLSKNRNEVKELADSFVQMRESVLRKLMILSQLSEVGSRLSQSKKLSHAFSVVTNILKENWTFDLSIGCLIEDNELKVVFPQENSMEIQKALQDKQPLREMVQNLKTDQKILHTFSGDFSKILNDPSFSSSFLLGISLKYEGCELGFLLCVMKTPFKLRKEFQEYLKSLSYLLSITISNILHIEIIEEQNRTLEDKVKNKTAELSETLTQLESKHQQTQSFYHFISHELRTPITAMQPYVRFLKEGTECDPLTGKQIKYLNFFDDSLQRMTKLVNQILDLARIESENQKPPLQEIFISPIIQQVANRLKGLFKSDVKLNLVLIQPDVSVRGIWDDTETVVSNLISNAAKYTEVGSVTIKTVQENNGIKILVEDTGIGIESDHLEKIFDRFSRFDHRRMAQGTGLGLSITKALVDRMGGQIDVVSTKNKGSVFSVWLPLV